MHLPARAGPAMPASPIPIRQRLLATVLGLALLLAHLDFWRAQRERIWLGWIPEELLYRLVWMGLAFVYLVWFCARIWREEDA
jgi:hypothetical protein